MEGPFSEQKTLELMYPILLAVDAMHRKNVLHRDISPENLILKPDGTLTLIDFGAAREYTLDEDENLTVILKHGYAPDEQYHSGSRQGPWTDLYACCAVMYQMVSGLLPQDAASRRHKDELLPLDEIEGLEVTKGFARAIEKGMTIYATERYASIGKLLSDLDPEESLRKKKPEPDIRDAESGSQGASGAPGPGKSPKKETLAEKRRRAAETAWMEDEALAGALAAVQAYHEGISAKGKEAGAEFGREQAAQSSEKAKKEAREEDSSTAKGVIIAAVIGIAIFAAVLIYSVGRNSAAEVPDLSGMTEEEARLALEEAEFECSDESLAYYEYHDSVEEGLIYDQYPGAGERVSKEQDITVYVSKGRGVEVPDVTEMNFQEARGTLEPDFSVSLQFEENDSWENGQVISQSLVPGEVVKEGTAITLIAAARDMTGETVSEAEEALSELGMEVLVERQYSDEVEKDRVISFSLEGDSQAQLVVSDGPAVVKVPDLRGLSEEEAQQAAADAGLTAVLRNDKKLYSEYGRGTVAYQHLEPGMEVETGSRIYYDTSAGVPSRGSVTLEASTTSVTLKKGGDAVAVTFYTNAVGGCICYTPAGMDAQMGDWFEGQPFNIYLSADENAVSGMTQVYIYTGKMAQGTDVVVDYVNISCTVVD